MHVILHYSVLQGGQINISGALASKQSLSFLVGASASDSAMSSVEDQHAIKIAQSGNADLELSSEVVSAVRLVPESHPF